MDRSFRQVAFERFGVTPKIIARAPGRVNLIGDHIDYCGGSVLPIAINRHCYAAVIPFPGDSRCTVSSGNAETAFSFETNDTIEPMRDAKAGTWGSYVIGVAAGIQKHASLDALSGHRIHVDTDIPLGAGLSSSAALEVATALAISDHVGFPIFGIELAKLCQRAEHEFAGVPCGLMDQATSVLARHEHALHLDCATGDTAWPVLPESAKWYVINSGIRHSLADGQYARVRETCQAAATKLGTTHLALADIDSISDLIGFEHSTAKHAITENNRVLDSVTALEKGDLNRIGTLMSMSHLSLRDELRVSCPQIDTLVERLMKIEGMLGARMTGGGFGGCVIALSKHDLRKDVKKAVEQCRHCCPNASLLDIRSVGGAELLNTED